MCTGDNILTAISVARECNLIDRTAHCFVPHFVEGLYSEVCCIHVADLVITGDSQDPKAQLAWESIDNGIFTLDSQSLTVCS
jgi:cation-transporting ATPase 13A2